MADSIALYNPKYLDVNGRRVINTTHVFRFIWDKATWNLKTNELKKFPYEVGVNMLKNIGFLVEVTPKNIAEIKKLMAEALFRCDEPECKFETDKKSAFISHSKTHGNTPENDKLLQGIEDAHPVKKFFRPGDSNPGSQDDIPQGEGKDQDGVSWYDEGWTQDSAS